VWGTQHSVHVGEYEFENRLNIPPLLDPDTRPELVVDINGLTELDYIREDGGPLRIGAMTRQVTLERSELVRRRWPLLDGIRACGRARRRGGL
jgi:CO/xanthine dehydrogenase FAD-binding subunit